jgi:SNF2 family DNA or RNA helicase
LEFKYFKNNRKSYYKECNNVKIFYLNSEIKDRENEIEQFNKLDNNAVMLLSNKLGVGFNLTKCEIVIQIGNFKFLI